MHFLGIFLAAVAMFAIGSVWYSPLLFIKAWLREAGMDPSQKPDSQTMMKTFGATFLLLLICAAVLDQVITNWTSEQGVFHGLWVGFLGGVIAAATTAINYLFEKKSRTLFLINAGYNVLGFCVMGVILSLI
ncbi:MAG: DUF1761 domain-containing protein [Bacillota bacterium]